MYIYIYSFLTSFQRYLYAVGGNDGAASLDSCERYDPHLNKWTVMANMIKRRAGAGCAELEGILYVVGKCQTYESSRFKESINMQ